MTITTQQTQTTTLARKVQRGAQLLTAGEGFKTVAIVRHAGPGVYFTFTDGRCAFMPHGETVTVR